MTAFAPLLDLLADVPDPRRAQGKLYQLPHVLLFAILAIVTGANSYRGIVTVFESAKALEGSEWQPHVAAIIRVGRSVYTRSSRTGLLTHTTETAFYVANAVLPANKATGAARGHRGIENTSHDSRDVTMLEDASRIRCNPGIFARLRSFADNIIKANRIDTLNQDRYRAALGGLQRLLEMLAIRKR